MTREEFSILCRPEVTQAIAGNRGRNAAEVALDRRIPFAREVASQVKYLARAESKLPSYAAAGCIVPPRAFEQSSGEPCAARKPGSGGRALDLTCGLGVDALYLSKRFAHVTAVERDEVLADTARENFRRLGISNVEVVCAAAEDYAASCRERFDWIYADPDRRDGEGRKMVRMEDCSPDMERLMPFIRGCGARFCIKLSPLFDVGEAFRIFGDVTVECVSSLGECKEVLVFSSDSGPHTAATALHADGSSTTAAFPREESSPLLCTRPFEAARYRVLGIPDAALQKARLVSRTLAGIADVWSENGFAFFTSADTPPSAGLCRRYAIESIEPYSPRRLRRELKGAAAEIFKRDCPLSPDEIRRACGLRDGAGLRAAVTRIDGEYLFIRLGAQLP